MHRELFPKEIIPGIVRRKEEEREGGKETEEINFQDGKTGCNVFKY